MSLVALVVQVRVDVASALSSVMFTMAGVCVSSEALITLLEKLNLSFGGGRAVDVQVYVTSSPTLGVLTLEGSVWVTVGFDGLAGVNKRNSFDRTTELFTFVHQG